MKTKEFDMLVKKLDGLIRACGKSFDEPINDTDSLTLKQARELVDTAKTMQGQMDIVLTSELYHIIGMGNLSASQQITFLRKIRELLYYRPIIKSFASSTFSVISCTDATYRCKVLDMDLVAENYKGES